MLVLKFTGTMPEACSFQINWPGRVGAKTPAYSMLKANVNPGSFEFLLTELF